MKIKQRVMDRLAKTKVGKRVICEQRDRIVLSAVLGFLFNFLYAVYHGVLGITQLSLWFITMCAYYTILSAVRFSAVLCERKSSPGSSTDMEYFVMKLSGALLVLLSFVLTGAVYISLSQNIAKKYGEIIMITIATYTFYKITMAIIHVVKERKNASPLLAVIRRIGYAEVVASIFTLQRSMIASFGTMDDAKADVMNLLTGSSVCVFVCILGMVMMIKGINKERSNDYT